MVTSGLWDEGPLYFCKDHVSLSTKYIFFMDIENTYDYLFLYVFWGGCSQNTEWHKLSPCTTGIKLLA